MVEGTRSSQDTLIRGREAFARHAWGDAFVELSEADGHDPLEPADLDRLAQAAYLIGKQEVSMDLWTRAHHEFLASGEEERAAGSALWMAFLFLNGGEMARAGGWIARARRILDDGARECIEQGYLLVMAAMGTIFEGDAVTAAEIFSRSGEIGERFDDADLVAIARMGRGRACIYLGRTVEGVSLLDEAMVAVIAGEVSTVIAGDIYCSVIEACHETFDLRRAQEWTAALSAWCDAQPDLVLYRGQCLVHRAEIMQLHGTWSEAMHEAERACERLAQPPGQPAVGAAFYQVAELHRLRGDFGKADDAYARASRHGREPQPGLSLLRLAQGQVGASEPMIRRVIEEAQDPVSRSRLLPALVEILLASDDVEAARTAVDELSGIASELDAPMLRAAAAHAEGAVLLAEGDASPALSRLRDSAAAWQGLDAPCEAARVRVLIGLACRALGDGDTAEMEIRTAAQAFEELGAVPDLAHARALSSEGAVRREDGLTPRELEVLRLVATGKTNRAIADALFISDKTVARHVSNIFTKLGLSSRSAATAYAYEHELV
jgi:DNA-binding CsgD family transcriptional regulator